MAERRKKSHSLLLRTEGKTVSLSLYPASLWPCENGGEGLFRVRLSGAWHCPTGKYSFLSRSAIGELVAALLNGGETPVEEPAPYLPMMSDVTVWLDTEQRRESGRIRTEPYQRRDGRWYCQAWVFGRGVTEFCCNDVTLRRIRR